MGRKVIVFIMILSIILLIAAVGLVLVLDDLFVSDDIQMNEVNIDNESDNVIEEDEQIADEGVEVSFSSSQIQKIYPFTGAFPHQEAKYLYKLSSTKDLTNSFVLRMAFAKVTKDDWADSYDAENEPLSIPVSILEKYIKDIFGNVDYIKEDFDNYDLRIGSKDILYKSRFHNDMINIEFTDTDTLEESLVYIIGKRAVMYNDRIEISLVPVILKFEEEVYTLQGESYLEYTMYARYNFETMKYETELMKNVKDNIFDEENKENLNIDTSKLDVIKLIYTLDERTGEYYFSELVK